MNEARSSSMFCLQLFFIFSSVSISRFKQLRAKRNVPDIIKGWVINFKIKLTFFKPILVEFRWPSFTVLEMLDVEPILQQVVRVGSFHDPPFFRFLSLLSFFSSVDLCSNNWRLDLPINNAAIDRSHPKTLRQAL